MKIDVLIGNQVHRCTSKERAIEVINSIPDRPKETPEQVWFECQTPITASGDIIWNNGKQAMFVSDAGILYTGENTSPDTRKDFCWIPIKRKDLKTGDAAYRADFEKPEFKFCHLVCCIVDSSKYWHINDPGIIFLSTDKAACFPHWFKLVRKSEIGV